MLNESNQTLIKSLTRELKTTQASLVNALVEFALENADKNKIVVEPAKKRGRKSKPAIEAETTA